MFPESFSKTWGKMLSEHQASEISSNAREKPILAVIIAGIGDIVLASESIRALRNGHPETELHVLTSAEAAPIAENCRYVDKVWRFPIRQFRSNKTSALEMIKIIGALRNISFSQAINFYRVSSFSGTLKMGLLFALIKADKKIGHDNKGFGFCVDKKIPRDNFTSRHFSEAMLDIAVSAGAKPDGKGLDVFYSADAEKKLKNMFDAKSGRMLVGINPGGDRLNRRWQSENYAAVADKLAEKHNAEIVVFGGPGEKHVADSIQAGLKYPPMNLAGQLSVDELVYAISRLNILITNDSGPMHIAAALKIPVTAIFGPEDPVIFGPRGLSGACAVVCKENLDCRPCKNDKCRHVSCLQQITPDEVAAVAEKIIEKI